MVNGTRCALCPLYNPVHPLEVDFTRRGGTELGHRSNTNLNVKVLDSVKFGGPKPESTDGQGWTA